jgi:hypothetical protein
MVWSLHLVHGSFDSSRPSDGCKIDGTDHALFSLSLMIQVLCPVAARFSFAPLRARKDEDEAAPGSRS